MPGKKMVVAEVCDKSGAEALAVRLANYWRKRGFHGIRTSLMRIAHNGGRDMLWCVRSNIGPNGFPPRLAQV